MTADRRFSRCALFLLCVFPAPAVAADKPETWVEVRSPNFVVVSSAGEKQARNVAEQFELFRGAFAEVFPQARVDLGKPLTIFAVKNEKGLRALLPGFWEKKGQFHPAGVFVPGQEKLYVALRTDTEGEFPFQLIYHEYAHALMRLNFRDLPVWLNEGMAEIFAHSLFTKREVTMGRPASYHLMFLQESKLLPLDVLFDVDHNSPHYNEQNKVSVFYSQSWAVTHYIYLSKEGREGNLLVKYLTETLKGVPPAEAAQRVFGDLKKFERTLREYIRQQVFYGIKTKGGVEVDERAFPARALNEGEALALLGDFHVHMNRPAEARATLERALKVDPKNAQAHESMGLLHLRDRDLTGAGPWFAKASELDSKSYLTHYYAAMMDVQRGLAGGEAVTRMEASLKRALELNPKFAPAYSLLATVYMFREDRLEDALKAAQQAAKLEPGEIHLHINVANILMRMKRVDEAITLGQSVLAAAKDAQQRGAATRFLQNALEYKDSLARYEAARKQQEEAAARVADALRQREAEEEAHAAREAAERENYVDPSGQQGVARGAISAVSCTQAGALILTLQLSQSALKLRAANRANVAYYSEKARTARRFDPCTQLRNLRAEVIYRPVTGKTYIGEILAIEMLPAEAAGATTASAGGAAPNTTARAAIDSAPPKPQPVSSPAGGSAAAGRAPAPTPAGAGSPPRKATGWAEGRIIALSCAGPELNFTLDLSGGFTLKLHTVNYFKVEFLQGPEWTPMDNFQPCDHLKGRSVETAYLAVDGKPYGGEIVSIKLLR